MDMRQGALSQARKAFAESREEIFDAMETINDILEYAKENGILALSREEFFRQEEEPYILDSLEQERKIPLKSYLAFGLERVSCGDDMEMLDALLENKYYVNGYIGKEAYISYIYLIGITGIAQGLRFQQILECWLSLIPDSEEEAFEAFASRWETGGKGVKRIGTVIQFGKEQNKEGYSPKND